MVLRPVVHSPLESRNSWAADISRLCLCHLSAACPVPVAVTPLHGRPEGAPVGEKTPEEQYPERSGSLRR